MRWRRRVVVVLLALAAFGVWGVGVRSGLVEAVMATFGLVNPPPISGATAATPVPSSTSSAAVPSHTPTARQTATHRAISPTAGATRSHTRTRSDVLPTATSASMATDLVVTETPTPSPTTTRPAPPAPLPSSAMTLTPPTSERFLLVDQDRQTMAVYENGQLVHLIPVSTGAPYQNSFTPAWSGLVGPFWGKAMFRGTDLWADYIWYLFPGPLGSILIHSVPYMNNGDEKVYDRLETLGVEPASKGCVRISPEDAKWLAEWDPVGVAIEITPYSGIIRPATEGE